MNRRTFLTQFLTGTAGVIVTPQIVTHGLHLRKLIVPVHINLDQFRIPYLPPFPTLYDLIRFQESGEKDFASWWEKRCETARQARWEVSHT